MMIPSQDLTPWIMVDWVLLHLKTLLNEKMNSTSSFLQGIFHKLLQKKTNYIIFHINQSYDNWHQIWFWSGIFNHQILIIWLWNIPLLFLSKMLMGVDIEGISVIIFCRVLNQLHYVVQGRASNHIFLLEFFFFNCFLPIWLLIIGLIFIIFNEFKLFG